MYRLITGCQVHGSIHRRLVRRVEREFMPPGRSAGPNKAYRALGWLRCRNWDRSVQSSGSPMVGGSCQNTVGIPWIIYRQVNTELPTSVRSRLTTWSLLERIPVGMLLAHSMNTLWMPFQECQSGIFFSLFEYLILMSWRSHESLKLTKVNTYGLFYEWKGLDDTLKPLLLAAHQGV